MNKQVVLFIVEGQSDQTSFDNILNRLLTNDKIKFIVIHGDITTKSMKYNATKKLSKKIIEFLHEPKNNFLNVSDIRKIVHLVDLDGAFINPNKIVKNDKNIKEFRNNCYAVPNISNIISRNKNKSEVIKKLATTNYIAVDSILIPYEIYYFSCNLEHVLHDNPNVQTEKEKIELSDKFAETYLGYEQEFIKFINSQAFADNSSYQISWHNAMKEENALKRKTNFNLFFKKDD